MRAPIKNIDLLKKYFKGKHIPDTVSLKFDIGDKVKITNYGKSYLSHFSAMRFFKICSYQEYNRLDIDWKDDNGEIYTVENVAVFSFPFSVIAIYLIHLDSMDKDNGYIVIQENGIDFINKTYKRRSQYRNETGIAKIKNVVCVNI